MSRIRGIRRLFRLPATESTLSRDIDEEIGFHIESRVEELMSRGMSGDDARRAADREFGDAAAARVELAAIDRVTLRRERRADWWDAVAYDVRHAARGMRRNVAFSLAVVLTLALGIGVNAAMFGITDHLLLRAPAHVAAADDVVRVLTRNTPPWTGELTTTPRVPYAQYAHLRQASSFEEMAAYGPPTTRVLGAGEDAAEMRVVETTATYFPLLGVRPALGRFFAAEEDGRPRGEKVVVLSHGMWQSRFGGDRDIIGRVVHIDHAPFTVIGVAPQGFRGIDLAPVHGWVLSSAIRPDAWPFDEWYTTRSMYWLHMVARLAPGVSAEAAAAEATALYRATPQEDFGEDETAAVVLGSVIAARAPEASGTAAVQRSGRIALWLLGVAGVVLVIACLNVANLLLARALRRRREIGVRMAMGVGRFRLAAQVLTETLVIAAVGAGLGLLLAHWAGQAARSLLLPDVEWLGSPIDRRVLLFAAAAAFASALLAGLLPALHAARSDVSALLSLGGRGSSARRTSLRSGLVALQAALSILLLIGAGLFVRSLHTARSVPLGFDPDGVIVFNWYDTGLGWDAARRRALYDQALERVQQLPQVEAAALAQSIPFHSIIGSTYRVPGLDSIPTPPGGGPYFNVVTPGYFAAMRSRVLRGRGFTASDVDGSAPVALVTASLGRLLWPGEDALGKCVIYVSGEDDSPCREIVGVVEDIRVANVESAEPSAMFYLPRAQFGGGGTLVVRAAGDPAHTVRHVAAAMGSLEQGLPYVQSFALRERIDPQLQPWRLGALLFTAFGGLALLLAGLGLYGVVAYDVAQRTREIGVRVALGARTRNLLTNVVGGAFRLAACGVIVGLAVAGLLVDRLEPLLFRVSPRDPAVLAGAALAVVLVALAAALVPARRALRVHPAEALRGE